MLEVAVKQPKQSASGSNDKVKLLQEAAILGQFKHPRVTKLYGLVTESEPVSISERFVYCTCNCNVLRAVHVLPLQIYILLLY